MLSYFLKHKAYKDVCFRVNSQTEDTDAVHLEISWWNLGQTTSYPMGLSQKTKIEYTDFPNWLYTDKDARYSLRNVNWKELSAKT